MTTENLTIVAGANDSVDDGTTQDYTATLQTMGFTGAKAWTSGYRFVPVTAIPAGATITAIDLGLHQTGRGGTPSLRIKFEHVASPAAYDTGGFPSARVGTTAYEDWAPPSGTEYKHVTTADLIATLQEVVDAHAPLSAVNVLISDLAGAGDNYFQSPGYESGTNLATLDITYTPAATGGWLKYRHI